MNSTQNYHSPISQKLEFKGGVLLRDTSVTPYTRLPVSTDAARRDRPRDGNLPAIYGNLMAICRILPYSAKFCQDRSSNPILLRARVDQATKLTIYTLSPRFLTFSPYATSWLHHAVHVHSLIISTLLYITIACARSVTIKESTTN